MDINVIAIDKWLKENENQFIPPVSVKMMHETQLKVFFVGGPNDRTDYHLDEGEEFFYMVKGEMCLKVIERGEPKDIFINEGEVFLLPGKIPHSPQRKANTIGLVIERQREKEWDVLRYYINGSTNILFERWFHCIHLGSQMEPMIKEFLSSEEYKTGKPKSDSINKNPPYVADSTQVLEKPFSLNEWIKNNMNEITNNGFKPLFGENYKSKILVYGGSLIQNVFNENCETFLWQTKNNANIEIGSLNYQLEEGNTILVPTGNRFSLHNNGNGVTLAVSMPPPK